MRHQVLGKHLGRTSAHRIAMRRNMAASLFEHGTISTTIEKARFVKPFAEKLITLAKNGNLHARRRAIALLQDRKICKVENNEPVEETTVIRKLFSEIGPQYADRDGGYTRIIKLPFRRIGDNGRLVLLQLVGDKKITRETTPKVTSTTKPIDVEVEEPTAESVSESITSAEQGAPSAQETQVAEEQKDADQPQPEADAESASEKKDQ